MKFEKTYVVGVVANGTNLYFKKSNQESDDADFTFVCSKAKHFDDEFVADAVAKSLEECGYEAFVDDFISIQFGN